ncbi:hypothetical protein ACIF8W_28515 [Streptomyces sp. NPDC085639]|uniref:hypothetical protein n=1 Tax=Streptomyces sp. NPDC085639 TaxID=3365734 RepID=UPI0037D61C58
MAEPVVQLVDGKPMEMSRRSWYATQESGDALALLVDEIYWETREPKYQIISALFRFAAEHGRFAIKEMRQDAL